MNLAESVKWLFGSAVSSSNENWEAAMAEYVRLLNTNGYDDRKPKSAPAEHARCPDDIQ